jgi:hypothetical protein
MQTDFWRFGNQGGASGICPSCKRPYIVTMYHDPGNRDHEELRCPWPKCDAIAWTGHCTTASIGQGRFVRQRRAKR